MIYNHLVIRIKIKAKDAGYKIGLVDSINYVNSSLAGFKTE